MTITPPSWEAKDVVTLVLALASFVLSAYTFWETQLRRGRLKMTQPTVLCLTRQGAAVTPKVLIELFSIPLRAGVARFRACF